MTKDQKQEVIELLKGKFSQYNNFYITDTEKLSVDQVTKLRRHCFDKQVEMKVAKNTLIKKALESLDAEKYSGVYQALNNVTALLFSENPKDPAMIISSFRTDTKGDRPVLKAAFINGDVYLGDDQLKTLTKIKTRNELIGEVIGLLQSPAKRVIAALLEKGKKIDAAVEATPVAEAAAPTNEAAAPTASATPAVEAVTETPAAPEAPATAEAPAPPEAPDAPEKPAAPAE